MKCLAVIIFLVPRLILGQENLILGPKENLDHYIHSYSQVDGNTLSSNRVSNFIRKIERKEIDKNSPKFLRFLFTKTHQQFLRHYVEYSSFSETVEKGKYDCLTGTALYALLLDYFDIEYKIIETNYHIFLLASTAQGKVLLEATDPLNGLEEKQQDIEARINLYKENRIQEASLDKKYYRYNFNLYNQVNLDQIEGLLHYNRSVVAFNEKNLHGSIQRLDKALDLYNSPRMVEFSTILLLAVVESNLNSLDKEECFKNIQALRRKQLQVMASRNFN